MPVLRLGIGVTGARRRLLTTMAAQPHRILRQVLELRGCARDQALPLGDALRTLYLEQLLPVIDAACDAVAGPDRLLRVERLELDLGTLPWDAPAALRSLAAERLAQALPARLVDAAAIAPALDGERELLQHFAASGTLPWWADVAEGDPVAQAIARLSAAPSVTRALLRSLAGRPDAWRRLLPHGGDAQWDAWLALVVAGWPALAAGPLPALAEAVAPAAGAPAPAGTLSATALRAQWWPPLLAAAGAGHTEASALIGEALESLAHRLDRDAAALWSAWGDALARRGAALGGVAAALDRRYGRASLAAAQARVDARVADRAAELAASDMRLARRFGRWAEDAAGPALWGRLAAVLDRLPPTLRRAAAAEAAPARLAALVASALAQGLLAPEAAEAWAAADDDASALTGDAVSDGPDPRRALRSLLRELPRRERLAVPAADDALQVGNAGIVLLWPFLGPFFGRLGLVAERRFVDPAAAQRACRLLHFLASGDAQPAEYRLPLCKLLCGLDVAAPIDEDTLPDEAAQAEGELLLQSVIVQAAVLREMSVPAFRGSFLLRRGRLGARDDHHLLRVEREGWDIVIERFGWSAAVVRLPWMATVLQVQW